jgi:outer membrane protein assembly factor BamB
MRKLILIVSALTFCSILGWSAEWLTDGYDSQRTHWQKDENLISPSTAKNIKLLWKLQLDSKPRVMTNLYTALIADPVTTSAGSKQIALVAGVTDKLFAIDVEKGTVLWTKQFTSTHGDYGPLENGAILCPGGQTATPYLQKVSPGKYTIYAVSGDGMLHQLNLADGEDVAPPNKFVPPGGKIWALNVVKGVIYTHTSQGCGGNPNVAYAYDLATNKVGSWGPAGGGMWGRTGPAVSPTTGAMYTGTGDGQWRPEEGVYGNGIIGLKQDPKTKELKLYDYFGPRNAAWLVKRDLDAQVTPVIFPYKGRELMVSGSKECRLWVMDTKSIGGDDHRSAAYETPLFCNEDVNFASAGIWGSLATWEDSDGTRWLLSPFWGPKHSQFKVPIQNGPVKKGGVMAFKVVDTPNGGVKLDPVWMSRDLDQGEPPVVANGVVFTYASGEATAQAYPDVGLEDTSQRRIPASTHSTLYALDAKTGKELWSSGDDIKSWLHFGELSVANGRVYIGTWDGILYCYGIQK